MNYLHTLRSFNPSKQSVANIWALGELLNLRVLDLWISDGSFASKGTHMDALLSSLGKLISCNLKILSIVAGVNVGRHGRWSSLSFSSSHLEELLLYFQLPVMPAWVCQLRALTSLKINVVELCEDDVALLAGLPVLARLNLDAKNVPSEGVVFSGDSEFRALGYFRVPYVAQAGVTFEAGSMAQVETLRFLLTASDVKRQAVVNLRCDGCDEAEVPVIKAAIRSAFDAHPTCSSIHIQFY